MFVKGDPNLGFPRPSASVIDSGHAVGVDHIGLITPKNRGRPVAGNCRGATPVTLPRAVNEVQSLAAHFARGV